jgi:hypothetical protein
MDYDPLDDVVDSRLSVDKKTLDQLRLYKSSAKFSNLPGLHTTKERERLEKVVNDLVERLLLGVVKNPTKRWVLAEFQRSLILVEHEDTEARDHFGTELEQIMDILNIDSSDGLLGCYLGGI